MYIRIEFEPKQDTVLFLPLTVAFTDSAEFVAKRNGRCAPSKLLAGESD